MSGGLVISDGVAWIVATWCAGAGVRAIRRHLSPEADASVLERLAATELYRGNLARFEDASPTEIRALHRAACDALAYEEAAGPVDWGDADFFPGFLDRMRDLIASLEADPRLRS